MANVTIKFNTDNAAFEDYGYEAEVKQVLAQVAEMIANGGTEGRMYDTNGNCVGTYTVE